MLKATGIGILKLVDDILVFADTVLELEKRIEQLFKRCLEHQITLADDKIQAVSEVLFGGYVVKGYGTKPDPTKIEAIWNFPESKDLTNLRSFIGLSNQFGDFSPDLKQAMEPLKGLLSQKNAWVWNNDHTNAMNKVKEIITGPQCLARFDPKKPIVLITDASRIGLGFVLIQPDNNDEAFDNNGYLITQRQQAIQLKNTQKAGW